MKKIIIRCDGSFDIGLGHVIRCLALADMLRDSYDVKFCLSESSYQASQVIADSGFEYGLLPQGDHEFTAIKSEIKGHVCVLDGYHFGLSYQKQIYSICDKLVSIDDIAAEPFISHVVINHHGHGPLLPYKGASYTRFYLGTQYALLRPEFYSISNHVIPKRNWPPKSILVCCGGSDFASATLRFIRALGSIIREHVKDVTAVVGGLNKSYSALMTFKKEFSDKGRSLQVKQNVSAQQMQELMMAHDLFIGTAGGILLEAFAMRIPTICGIIADNQVPGAEYYAKEKALINLGWVNDLSDKDLQNKIQAALVAIGDGHQQQQAQEKLVDGQSKKRIKQIFEELML